jgi:hypothetical protein
MAPTLSRGSFLVEAGEHGGQALGQHRAADAGGLWRVQADSLRKHLDHAATPARLYEVVTADVRRAARIVETGLQVLPAAG